MRNGPEIAQWIEFLQDKYGDSVARDYMNLPSEEFVDHHGVKLEHEIEYDQKLFEIIHPL